MAVYQDGTAQGQIGETSVGGRDKQGLAMGAVDIFSLPHTLRTLLYAPSPPLPPIQIYGLMSVEWRSRAPPTALLSCCDRAIDRRIKALFRSLAEGECREVPLSSTCQSLSRKHATCAADEPSISAGHIASFSHERTSEGTSGPGLPVARLCCVWIVVIREKMHLGTLSRRREGSAVASLEPPAANSPVCAP